MIAGYREVQKPLRSFSKASRGVLERLVAATFPHFTTFLPLIGGPLVAVVNFILPSVIYAKLVRLEPLPSSPESM